MTRFQSFIVTLVAAAFTLPVEAARPQSPSRGGAGRQMAMQRQTAAPQARPGHAVPRAPTAASRSHVTPSSRPTVGAARTNGGRTGAPQQAGRMPIDVTITDTGRPKPGIVRPRPDTIARPGLDVSYQEGPEIKMPNGGGNGGGGNGGGGNGGGNGGGGNGGGGNGGGNNGGGNNGGQRPPHGRRPCRGPSAWDVIAIGLATAAFADGGGVQGGCLASECVTVGQPSCGDVTTVVESPVAVAEPAPLAEALPQLRVGEPFQLPARGLGDDRGHVAVKLGAAILDCPVTDWTDAGLAATLPAMTLATPVRAELVVAFADGTLAAVVPVELLPAGAAAAE